MIRPAGRYISELDVVVCSVENFSSAVIASIARNLDERTGGFRHDREPESVGDCIVHDCLPTGNACGPHGWRVRIGERWFPATDLQHALDIVAVARGADVQEAA